MKRTIPKHLGLALIGLVLAVSGSIASAQSTNIVHGYDTNISPWYTWYNISPTFAWNDTNDASSNVASGSLSLYLPYGIDGNGNNSQSVFFSNFADTYAGDPNFLGIDFNNYATVDFDVLVDKDLSTPNNAGNYGTMQFHFFNNYSTVFVGQDTILADAATNWQHIHLVIPAGIGTWRGPAFWFQNWVGPTYPNQPNGPVTYYVDNLTITAKPPSPAISIQPVSQEVFAGKNVGWNVQVSGGQPLVYQWYKGATPLADGDTGTGSGIFGATTNFLMITNVSAADIASYSLWVTNDIGSITSSVVSIKIATPTGNYAQAVTNLGPYAFYELNETNNPAAGSAPAYDHVGGFVGIYGTTVSNLFGGVAGPAGTGFTTPNGAAQFPDGGGRIALPALNLNTNEATFIAWINMRQPVTDDPGIIFIRGSGSTSGMVAQQAGAEQQLGYNWADNSASWGFQSGLILPTNEWALAAMVITANDATLYLLSKGTLNSANNAVPNAVQGFAGTTYIGQDSLRASRTFPGSIDDVTIFNYALTPDQIQTLYFAGAGGPTLRFDGQNLSWDILPGVTTTTTLWEAPGVTGPWTLVDGATSPWPVTTLETAHFYKLKVE